MAWRYFERLEQDVHWDSGTLGSTFRGAVWQALIHQQPTPVVYGDCENSLALIIRQKDSKVNRDLTGDYPQVGKK
jgi:hypothetical protein